MKSLTPDAMVFDKAGRFVDNLQREQFELRVGGFHLDAQKTDSAATDKLRRATDAALCFRGRATVGR